MTKMRRTLQFILLMLLLITLTGCGDLEWFPDATSPPATQNNTTQNNTNMTQINNKQMGGSIQTNLSSLSGSVTTIAGVVPGSADGTGTAARFQSPMSVATDGTNVYVADSDNHTIRKVVIATGVVTTLAGTAGISGSADGTGSVASFNYPLGVTTDGTNLYVSDTDNCTIRKIVISTGEVSTLAGTAGASFGVSIDGIGPAASFNSPMGITTDGTNLFVADFSSSLIRKIVIATGAVTTLAGTSGSSDSADGIGPAAHFSNPMGLTTNGTNLYVADSGNKTIRQIVIATGAVTTLAGTAGIPGFSDGAGSAARFHYPTSIAMDGTNLYVADTNNQSIRMIAIASGAVTTLAGMTGRYGFADGTGTTARFYFPWGVSTDGTNLYVADSENRVIRKIVIATRSVSTLAGYATLGSNDGTGTAARFAFPGSVTTDGTNIFIADSYNSTIRKIAIASGTVTTLAGTAGAVGSADGAGSAARFDYPHGVTTDGANLYVADTNNNAIRKIVISTGVVTTLAGGALGINDGIGTAARFNSPLSITTDNFNLYVADCNNFTIRKIVIATGMVTTLAGSAGVSGSADGTGTAASFDYPQGVTTDGTNIYIADTFNNTIRKIVIATGAVSTFAGTTAACDSIDGVGTSAHFCRPSGIATDGTNIYVADNSAIRKIVIATGAVTTVAGTAGNNGYSDGIGALARFSTTPEGITTDGTSLFIADTYNNTIRRIQ